MTKTVAINDKMQTSYQYERTEPEGENFAEEFTPDLTPAEMLKLGIFGGVYMRDCREEFPSSWFENAKLANDTPKAEINYFETFASQPLAEWRRKGWIHDDDPRGWFQWYCRYYMGRRHEDDERQIKRWKNMKRHVGQIKAHCQPGDILCRRRQRQALLHWAYDSRKL